MVACVCLGVGSGTSLPVAAYELCAGGKGECVLPYGPTLILMVKILFILSSSFVLSNDNLWMEFRSS